MSVPTSDHLKAAHRLLRYIKGAPAQGLFFSSSSSLVMKAFCDADWAACPKTRRSTTESEYRSMAVTCSKILWLTRLLSDMKASVPRHITLHCDNQASIHITKNPVFHERT
ncbi:unnamed protein product [Rhodiola kirilowii]